MVFGVAFGKMEMDNAVNMIQQRIGDEPTMEELWEQGARVCDPRGRHRLAQGRSASRARHPSAAEQMEQAHGRRRLGVAQAQAIARRRFRQGTGVAIRWGLQRGA